MLQSYFKAFKYPSYFQLKTQYSELITWYSRLLWLGFPSSNTSMHYSPHFSSSQNILGAHCCTSQGYIFSLVTSCLSVKAKFCTSLLRKDHFLIVNLVSERHVSDQRLHYSGADCGKYSVEIVELSPWCIDENSLFFAPS